MHLSKILLHTHRLVPSFIKNNHIKPCSDCIYFIKPKLNDYPYGSQSTGRCKQFGEKHVVTGQINYAFALTCRMDNTLCGISAKYFEHKFEQE